MQDGEAQISLGLAGAEIRNTLQNTTLYGLLATPEEHLNSLLREPHATKNAHLLPSVPQLGFCLRFVSCWPGVMVNES